MNGFALDADEQRRRYLLYALFTHGGLQAGHYRRRFGTSPGDDFPDLATFADLGLITESSDTITLTPAGLERSDALGPWFFSDAVRKLTAGYDAR